MRPRELDRLILKVVWTVILMSMIVYSNAQDEKIAPRIDLTYYQSGDEAPYVTVRVRKRVERRYEPIAGIPVDVYFNQESDDARMGSSLTNQKGEGKVALPGTLRAAWNNLQEFEFMAVVSSSDTIEESFENIVIKRARLHVLADEVEESRTIRVILEEKTEDGWIPVEGADVKVFVKRDFGRLTVGDDFYVSDEDGAVEAEFAEEYPGDKEGMLTLGGMIEDHEDYGNVVAYTAMKWGVPLQNDNSFMGRSLWATRDKTPWWLLIFPNLIILSVWGVIVYLVLQIVRIKKLSKS